MHCATDVRSWVEPYAELPLHIQSQLLPGYEADDGLQLRDQRYMRSALEVEPIAHTTSRKDVYIVPAYHSRLHLDVRRG